MGYSKETERQNRVLGDLLQGDKELVDRAVLTDEEYGEKYGHAQVAVRNQRQWGSEIEMQRV